MEDQHDLVAIRLPEPYPVPLRPVPPYSGMRLPDRIRFYTTNVTPPRGESSGLGTISGTAQKDIGSGVLRPMNAMVRLYRDSDGKLMSQVNSSPTTGAFLFVGIPKADRYTALAYDLTHNYRAVVADNVAPV